MSRSSPREAAGCSRPGRSRESAPSVVKRIGHMTTGVQLLPPDRRSRRRLGPLGGDTEDREAERSGR